MNDMFTAVVEQPSVFAGQQIVQFWFNKFEQTNQHKNERTECDQSEWEQWEHSWDANWAESW